MQRHFPALADEQVTLANWREAPYSAWAFHHVREIVPTAEIANDPAKVSALGTGDPLDWDRVFADSDTDLDAFHALTATDGLVILRDGRLIHESYRNMGPHDPHIVFSVSKSMLGLLAGVLAARGTLDVEAPCTEYVPEVADSAFAGARVRDLLDMRTGIDFDEDYLATSGPIIEYRKATNWNPLGPGERPSDLRSFFATIKRSKGPHGGAFDYKSPCTDLLGWIIERAAGQRYSKLFAELIWQPMGAERPASITVDLLGAPRVAGGLSMTTRDLARVGRMLVEDGAGIVPTDWIADLEGGGDAAAWDTGSMADWFPGEAMHYRAKWYTFRNRGPILMALGIHGQMLLVDRAAGLVLARQSSVAAPIEMGNYNATLDLFERVRDGF